MNEAIDAPDEMSPFAPRVITVKVPVDKIGEVIGPKGKMINQIQEDTGADISIEDDGTIYIGATDGPSAEAARNAINAIANPTMPEIGERFLGTVVKTTTFGAFVSLLPGKDGLLHISEVRKLVGGKRIDSVDDVLSIGQKVQVELKEVDPRGKLSLAMRPPPTKASVADPAATVPSAATGVTAAVAATGPSVATGAIVVTGPSAATGDPAGTTPRAPRRRATMPATATVPATPTRAASGARAAGVGGRAATTAATRTTAPSATTAARGSSTERVPPSRTRWSPPPTPTRASARRPRRPDRSSQGPDRAFRSVAHPTARHRLVRCRAVGVRTAWRGAGRRRPECRPENRWSTWGPRS
jgi:predicted RNA-binding protein with RPS1 domain